MSPQRQRAAMAWLAGATVACWVAWMGWDRHYDQDPVTGNLSGPYQPWQVIGCVVSLVLVAVVAGRWLPMWDLVLVMPSAFTVAWSVSAATAESVGANFWPIGAFLVLLGTGAATVVVGAVVEISWTLWWQLRRDETSSSSGIEN